MKSDPRTRLLTSFIINSFVNLFAQRILIEHLLCAGTFLAQEIQQEIRQTRVSILWRMYSSGE